MHGCCDCRLGITYGLDTRIHITRADELKPNRFLFSFFLIGLLFRMQCITRSTSILNNDDMIRIHFSLVRRASCFFVFSKIWLFYRFIDFARNREKKKWWKKYKLPVLCVRSYTYLFFPLHIHTDCSLHLRRRVQKVTFEAKKRNKFLSQLFGDFLRIRPYTSLRLYIL